MALKGCSNFQWHIEDELHFSVAYREFTLDAYGSIISIDRSISTDGCSRVVVRTQYIAIIVPKEGDQYTHNAHTR